MCVLSLQIQEACVLASIRRFSSSAYKTSGRIEFEVKPVQILTNKGFVFGSDILIPPLLIQGSANHLNFEHGGESSNWSLCPAIFMTPSLSYQHKYMKEKAWSKVYIALIFHTKALATVGGGDSEQ